MAKSNASIKQANAARWARASLTRGSEFRPVAKRLCARKARYQAIAERTGVPWYVIAVIHEREAGVDAAFKGNIANGQPWSRRTTIEPKGRGPFVSFEDAAYDALVNCKPNAGSNRDWSIGGLLTILEKYNGLGYSQMGKPSPYIWSGTDQYASGKYIRDHVYDANAVDEQLGCAGLLLAMREIDSSIVFEAPPATPAPAQAAPPTAPVPVEVKRPGLWTMLWGALRGKDAAIATAPAAARPGLAANGDAALYDQQDMLSRKGYTGIGQPDGLMGVRTQSAVRAFRREHGLPASDAIDAKFSAALLAAGPRHVAEARVEANATDLRDKGNAQVATLDGLGWMGKLIFGGGLLGAADQTGVLGKANDTLQAAQDTLGTVTTVFTTLIGIAQWCFAHWWMFALGGGVYVVFKAATGVLHVVVLFRQGFLARADR